MARNRPKAPGEYDLKIDEQVEKFTEIKQKLTYFLITASVAVIAFMVDYLKDNIEQARNLSWIVILSSISGLFTSGSSLLCLRYEMLSYKLHLKSRYEKKSFQTITPDERNQWIGFNQKAAMFQKSAFVFLFVEIALAVLFFVVFFACYQENNGG